MTAVTGRPSRARDDPRGPPGRRAHCDGGARQPIDPQPRLVLRCPGPLLALRSLAALYRVSAQRLATVLPACEADACTHGKPVDGALRTTVSDALGAPPLTPLAVHYFQAAWLRDPQLVLQHGLPPSATADAVKQCLGEFVSDATRAKWTAATQPDGDHPRDAAHLHAQHAAAAVDRGPRGVLVCDVLLQPALYGTCDELQLPALIEDLTTACTPYLGFDLARRFTDTTTPCIVEYRRPPAPDRSDTDAALRFVAAALRGTVSATTLGGRDTHAAPIAAHDIIIVRAVGTEQEWTAAPRK